jgi:hypothetical protein
MNCRLPILFFAALVFAATWCVAGESCGKDRKAQHTDSAAADNDNIAFSGWLLVTDDQDWREKWNTPETSVPTFSEVHEVQLGEKITILTFYRNPLPDENGQIDIRCDLTIIKPDGSLSFQQEDMACANETLQGNPANLRLTSVIVDFIGEIGDPYGRWTVEVTLKDVNRGVEIPLQTYFELKDTSRFTRWQLMRMRSEDGSRGEENSIWRPQDLNSWLAAGGTQLNL